MNKLLLNLALTAGIFAMSSCNKSDPFGTDGFNKNLISGYALQRAATVEKRPVIIDSVSDTQKMTLHGEVLLTSVVAERGEGLGQQRLLYFVSKTTGKIYLSGTAILLQDIDTNGFDAESDAVDKKIAADAKPMSAP
jgi:hypothetical protein